MATKAPPGWTPDKPLPDISREAFAQLLARGENAAEAYRQAIAKGEVTSESARSGGSKASREPAVVARVEAIRKARSEVAEEVAEEVEDVTAGDLPAIMGEVVEALERTYRAAEEASASPAQMSRIRQALTLHTNRLTAAMEERPTEEIAAPAIIRTDRVPWCRCYD